MEKNKRFAGMKTNPYANSPKNAIRDKTKGKKRKKKSGNGSLTSKTGLSPYQIRTQEEFMKVRENESVEQWLMRTRFRRIRTEEELAITKNGRKKLEKILVLKNKTTKKPLRIRAIIKDFNFLKYYIFVIKWASIKYNIPQNDIETGFHFYDTPYFTKEEFTNKCLMFSNPSANVFNRFKNEGYIREFLTTNNSKEGKKPTDLYRFTVRFNNMITAIYNKITFQTPFNFKIKDSSSTAPEVEKMILEMALENQDILSGKKEPTKFITVKK